MKVDPIPTLTYALYNCGNLSTNFTVAGSMVSKMILVSYFNDSYVKIEGICIPLQDMRGVDDDITYEALAGMLVPGCALVFEIDCKWDAVTGQLM